MVNFLKAHFFKLESKRKIFMKFNPRLFLSFLKSLPSGPSLNLEAKIQSGSGVILKDNGAQLLEKAGRDGGRSGHIRAEMMGKPNGLNCWEQMGTGEGNRREQMGVKAGNLWAWEHLGTDAGKRWAQMVGAA